jgi:deoxyribonuclease V
MRFKRLHAWEGLTPKAAIALQKKLADRVESGPALEEFDLIAGTDCSYTKFSPWVYAAVVLWRRSDGQVVEVAEAVGKNPFPYVPGLLSFREAPTLLEAFRKLKQRPDVIMVDGQGFAHPRRIGIACHLGLFLGIPTIGCGKSRLCGEHRNPAKRRGCTAELLDKGELIGQVLRTRNGVAPIYVSVGHRIDLPSAVRVAMECSAGYRIPEPTRQAHMAVNELRRRHIAGLLT